METIIFEVPRIKEEAIDKLLNILEKTLKPDKDNITYFHFDKCRNKDNTTLYVICYKE